MRTILMVSATVLALAACNRTGSATGATGAAASATAGPVGTTAAAGPAALPARKAGLWLQTMTRDGKAGHGGQMKMCIDASSDAKMNAFGQTLGKQNCQRTVNRGLTGGYSMVSTCQMGQGGTITSKGSVSGDFASTYRVHSESDISGASFAAMNGHHVTDIDGTYQGPCPIGMVPGDIQLANGVKVNANSFMGGGSAAPGAAGGQ